MPLRIDVQHSSAHPATRPCHVIFGPRGGTIGRLEENDLALPGDMEVSRKQHASIHYENGRYYLVDNSSNGTMVSNSLVWHDKVLLRTGDELRIGEYVLLVSMVEESSDESGIGLAETQEFEPEFIKSALNEAAPIHARSSEREKPTGDLPPRPLDREQPKPSCFGKAPMSIDDLFDDANPVDDALPASFPPDAEDGRAMEQESRREKALDGPQSIEQHDAPGPVATEMTVDEPESLEQPAAFGPVAPEKAREAMEISPDLPEHKQTRPQAREEALEVKETESLPASPPLPDDPLAATDPAASWNRERCKQEAYKELFEIFLKGAGIENAGFGADENIMETIAAVGAVFREMVDGLWTVLQGRTTQKAEIRLALTLVRPVGNNPIKFSPRAEDAVRDMLKRGRRSFLEPVDAVHEAFEDLMNHQIAMNAGVQASLNEALDRFDPEQLANKDEAGPAFMKKIKYWNSYTETYGKLRDEASEDFFGKTFIRVYEEQIEKLRSKRKKE